MDLGAVHMRATCSMRTGVVRSPVLHAGKCCVLAGVVSVLALYASYLLFYGGP